MTSDIIAWINVISLILSSLLYLFFYVKSAAPAALEKKIGEIAYQKCERLRIIASIFMTICLINYILYYFFPLPIPFPQFFPWDWWVSILIAIIIAIPGGYLWFKGMKDAGSETISPKKEHTLYKGIYNKMRHPQAVGETSYWWVFSFILNSPFLVLISFIQIPIVFIMCRAEEKDLVVRYGEEYLEYQRKIGFLFTRKTKE